MSVCLSSDGYNQWRDAKKPSAILAELCRKNGIPSPEYRTSEVKILNKIFKIPPEAIPEGWIDTLRKYLVAPLFKDTPVQQLLFGLQTAVLLVSTPDLLKKNQRSPDEEAEMEEHAALNILHRWGEMKEYFPGALALVPEHVEIRSLLNQDKPGLPQVTNVCDTEIHLHQNIHLICDLSACCRVTFICGWTCFPLMSQLHPL